MAATLPNGRTHQPHKQVERELSALVPRADHLARATLRDLPGGGEWLVACADRAMERTLSHKEAAATMGEDKSQLSNERKGIGNLTLKKLGLLGQDFFEAWIDEIREYFKLNNDAERLQRARELRARCDEVIDEIARKGLK